MHRCVSFLADLAQISDLAGKFHLSVRNSVLLEHGIICVRNMSTGHEDIQVRCIHACVYVCFCICVYSCLYVCIREYLYVVKCPLCVCACVCVCVLMSVCVCVHVCVGGWVGVCVCVCVCVPLRVSIRKSVGALFLLSACACI